MVWLAPAAVAVAGLYRPRWAQLIFVACLPLFGSPPGGPYLAALDATAIAVIFTSLRQPRPPRSSLTWPVAVFVFVALASLLPPVYSPPSWSPRGLARLASTLHQTETWSALYTWRAALDLLLAVGIFHAVRRCWWRRNPAPLAAALVSGLAVTGILGLLEYVEWIDLSGYRAIGQYVSLERMHSLFFNSGWLAEYFVIATPFAVAGLLALKRRTLAAALAVIALAVIVLAQQRGAWFTGAAQLATLAVLARKQLFRPGMGRRWAVGAVCLALLLAVTVLAGPQTRSDALLDRATTSFSDLTGREGLWRASLEMAPKRPLLGWGLGSFAPVYDSFHPPDSPQAQRPRGTAHSWYLNLLVETGILGLAAFALLAGAAAIVLRRALRGQASTERTLAVGVTVASVGALVYGLVQYMPHIRVIHWLMWMVLATACLNLLPQSRRWLRLSGGSLVVAVVLCLPFRWLVPQPEWRGDEAYGFREPGEGKNSPFQWAGPRAAIRVPWEGDCLLVPLANGHPATQYETQVAIRAAGTRRQVAAPRRWTDELIRIGPPRGKSLVVEMAAGPAFRPFQDFRRYDLEPSSDIRLLGVAVGDIESQACPSASSQVPVK